MRTVKDNIVKYGILCGIFALLMIVPKQVVFAGEINSDEAGLISAASGTFTYDGKTYRAGSAYINSLTAYLSEDDVDLSAEQCSNAISKMYANVAEGVERGYLYEVGEDGSQETSEASTEKNSKEEKKNTEKNNKKENSDDNKDDNENNESSGGNSIKPDPDDLDVWDSMSNQSEAKNKLRQRPEQESADASVKLEDDSIVVVTKDNETISFSKEEQLISNKVVYIIDIIAIAIMVITLLCGFILFGTKCMVFKKPKRRKARPGHTKRRRIRRYTRNILTITTAASFVAIFLLCGIYISIFNKNTIMQNMQSSGYFRYAYSEYVAGLADEIKDGKETIESSSISNYEDFLFTVKQNSLKILSGETDVRIPSSNVSPYIYNIKLSYTKVFCVGGILFILSAIVGIILMIFMDMSRERGTKHTAVAVLISSGIIVAVTLYMALVKPYLHLYIEPDYLYLFIMECILWSVKVMTSISAFSVVFGMLLIGVYKAQVSKKDS